MSGIVGVFNRCGRPVDPGLLERLTSTLAFRGGDGSGTWINGSVGFGFQALWTVPEAVGETAPRVDAATGVALVMDGRVDNREEILPELKGRYPATLGSRDSEFILWAYLHWGQSFIERVQGDFSIAIWDPRSCTLHCYRDRMGVRPFYFTENPDLFVFASEICVILGHPEVTSRPNEGMIGEYLASTMQSHSETLSSAVSRLPRGQAMSVTSGSCRSREYWSPRLQELRFPSDQEAADQFLFELRRAIKCRLRSLGPVGSHLSGGLDSSSLSVLAAEMCVTGGLTLFSAVFPGMKCDESYYIDKVRAMIGLPVFKVPFQPVAPDYFAIRAARYLDFPGHPNGNALNHDLCSHVRRQGTRVVLSGHGGNQVLEGETSFLADHLRQFRVYSFVSQARHYRRPGQSWYSILKSAAYPLLAGAPPLRGILRRRRGPADYPLLLPEFSQRIRLWDRIPAPLDWHRFGSIGRRDFVRGIFTPSEAFALEHLNRGAQEHAIEERMPFLDPRVVEFCIGLPERLRHRNRVYKVILRMAMAGRLPTVVLDRRVQAEFSEPYDANLRAAGVISAKPLRPFLLPEICSALDADPASLMGTPHCLPNWSIWSLLGVALALRSLDRTESLHLP